MTNEVHPSVLVVEDDPDLRDLIAAALQTQGFDVTVVGLGADGIARLEAFAFDALVVDLGLPDTCGAAVLDTALDRYPEIRCVVISGYGAIDDAVKAIKRGAIDFLLKPFQLGQLARVLQAGIADRRLRVENAQLRAQLQDRFSFGSVIGRSAAMRRVLSTLELVAPMNSGVLIQGETGTGKELIARTIHHNSPRRNHPFVAFNSAAIPDALAEAELFGHVKGAFTGAVSGRIGRFELAHRGTLFIDEVATMSMSLQAKLLRALQEREVERVGESRAFKFDIRVIAASNVDLRRLVKEGAFREDLFYRLNVVPIILPPLRTRREDIPFIAQHFLEKSCTSNRLPARTLSQAALRLLMDYAWPGNIRQLENAIEHAVAMSGDAREISPSMLPDELHQDEGVAVFSNVTIPDGGLDFVSVMAQVERQLLRSGLAKSGGNKRQAARLLNLSRTTLIDKLNRLGAEPAVSSAA
jgi:DNA-binding NtrC family response regulator